MFVIFLALGFNNAHPGMLGDSGAEYPMTSWEAAPIGAVKNQEQATWRDDVSKVPVELYDSDEFLSFAPSVPANSGHTMASEFEENLVSGNVNWSLTIVFAVSLLFFFQYLKPFTLNPSFFKFEQKALKLHINIAPAANVIYLDKLSFVVGVINNSVTFRPE